MDFFPIIYIITNINDLIFFLPIITQMQGKVVDKRTPKSPPVINKTVFIEFSKYVTQKN